MKLLTISMSTAAEYLPQNQSHEIRSAVARKKMWGKVLLKYPEQIQGVYIYIYISME